ncbi:MAG: hypothetical protein WC356_01485 [Candidatus Micrarchaeia archaeon]|jgi:transcription elongation factor Elf1
MTLQVLPNKWDGEKFETEFSCDRCGKLATTVDIDGIIALCAVCLNEAQEAISRAIMEGLRAGKERPCAPKS